MTMTARQVSCFVAVVLLARRRPQIFTLCGDADRRSQAAIPKAKHLTRDLLALAGGIPSQTGFLQTCAGLESGEALGKGKGPAAAGGFGGLGGMAGMGMAGAGMGGFGGAAAAFGDEDRWAGGLEHLPACIYQSVMAGSGHGSGIAVQQGAVSGSPEGRPRHHP